MLKRIEDAFNVISDYTIDLYYLSIQNKIKRYVDLVSCWECLDDLKCAYREIIEKINNKDDGIEDENYALDNKGSVRTHQ